MLSPVPDTMNKRRTKERELSFQREREQVERESQGLEIEEHEPFCLDFTPLEFRNALKSYSNMQEFKAKNSRGKSNRRKGDSSTPPLPTYRGGAYSAARLRENMVSWYFINSYLKFLHLSLVIN